MNEELRWERQDGSSITDSEAISYVAYLAERNQLSEGDRARIHALTRKVTMTDEDLRAFAQEQGLPVNFDDWAESENMLDALRELRDRYESLGKYAPAAQEAKP